MKELNEMVQVKLEEMASSGVIEKMISDNVEDMVSRAIQKQFERYGDLNKSLESALKNGLRINFEDIEYPTYNAIMLKAVKVHLDKYFGKQMMLDIGKQIETLLGTPPKEMSIYDLVNQIHKIIKDKGDDDFYDEYDEEFKVNVSFKRGDGSLSDAWYLKIDSGESYKKKDLVSLLFFGDEQSEIRVNHNHRTLKCNPTACFDTTDVINAFIFNLYSAKTIITGLDDFDADSYCFEDDD